MPMGTQTQRELSRKFFDPVINAASNEQLKAWLKKKDSDEIQQFIDFFNFTNHRDKESLLRQELEIRRQKAAKRASWIDRMVSFVTGVATGIVSAVAYSFLVG